MTAIPALLDNRAGNALAVAPAQMLTGAAFGLDCRGGRIDTVGHVARHRAGIKGTRPGQRGRVGVKRRATARPRA